MTYVDRILAVFCFVKDKAAQQVGQNTKNKMECIQIVCFFILFNFIECDFSCENNDCLCTERQIKCGDSVQAQPVFTILERLFVKSLHLTGKQKEYLPRMCGLFPALENVTLLMNNTQCPAYKPSCVKVDCK